MEWEVRIIEWEQAHLSSLGFMSFLAFLGAEAGLLMVVLIVMFCWRKKAGQKLALVVSCVNMWLPMIKSVVLRPRPYMEHPDRVEALTLKGKSAAQKGVTEQGYSFPSMHSASIPALYFMLAKEAKKKWIWILAAVLTLLVGFSRVVVGMHYPTDVLAGWVLGFVVIGIFMLLDRYVHKEWMQHLILLISAVPGLFYVRTTDFFTALGCLAGVIAAIWFERKYVNFQETRQVLAMILRVAGAFILYFVVNTLLKLPFDKEFLSGGSLGALLIRAGRYAVIMFLITGVYPMIFPMYERVESGN